MKTVTILLFLALAGCSRTDPVGDAEVEHNMKLAANPTSSQKCEAEQALAEAYLKAHSGRFAAQKALADQSCRNAQMERTLGTGT